MDLYFSLQYFLDGCVHIHPGNIERLKYKSVEEVEEEIWGQDLRIINSCLRP